MNIVILSSFCPGWRTVPDPGRSGRVKASERHRPVPPVNRIRESVDTGLDAVFFVLASMTVVDICTGWSGLYARLPGIRHPSTAVRILAKVLWSMLTFLAWIVILVLVQMLLT